MSDDPAPRIAAITDALRASRKYRDLHEPTLERIARDAAARHPRDADAVKAAKSRLHEVFAAFGSPRALESLGARVAALPDPRDPARRPEFDAGCAAILALHSSTAERTPILRDAYRAIFEITGAPRVVLDLACGLNPFALPLAGIAPDVEWRASDVHRGSIAAIGAFLARLGQRHVAETRDLLIDPPTERADVALLWKSFPTLDRQRTGAGFDVVRAIRADHVVVSFPTASLGRREKGMREQYRAVATDLSRALAAPMHAIEFETESFFVLDRRGAGRSTSR